MAKRGYSRMVFFGPSFVGDQSLSLLEVFKIQDYG